MDECPIVPEGGACPRHKTIASDEDHWSELELAMEEILMRKGFLSLDDPEVLALIAASNARSKDPAN